jgi:hypothetical protein
MNRRDFGKTALAVTVAGPALLSVEGCASSTIVQDINVVLNEAVNVLSVVAAGTPWLAEFKAAVAALQSAEASWEGGSTVQIVIDALNALVAITAVIPITLPYSPLIDVLVAAIEAVLVLLPSSTGSGGLKATSVQNPHVGAYKMTHRWGRSPAGDMKANWNDVAKAKGLTNAELQ